MFSNPVAKIKGLASIVFWLTLILAILGAIGAISDGNFEGFFSSLGLLLGAWLSSLALYALGCVVDDIQHIRECVERIEKEGIH